MAAETDPEGAERHYAHAMQSDETYKKHGGKLPDAAPLFLRMKRGEIWMQRDPARALSEHRAGLELYRTMTDPQQEANRRILANLVRKESKALAELKQSAEARTRALAAPARARRICLKPTISSRSCNPFVMN